MQAQQKKYRLPVCVLFELLLCLGLAGFQEGGHAQNNTQSTAPNSARWGTKEQDSTLTPPTLTQPPSCIFNFADTFYGTDSGTNPPSAPYKSYGPNNYPGYFGPSVQLQFNNYGNNYPATQYTTGFGSPTQYTPNVPCNGYYEISFTVEVRNNSGTSCNFGENAMSVWVTTTDPLSPNAYGCPPSYLDSAGNPQASPGVYTGSVKSCATFAQWVQCAWTNNFNVAQESGAGSFQYYGVQAFPIYMYTPTWTFQQYSTIHSVYPGMCYEPSGCYEVPGQFQQSYQTAFCSLKPFTFKNVVYLHAGAQISAPTLAGQEIYTPYNIAAGGYAECGFSVVGGKFKAVYLGP